MVSLQHDSPIVFDKQRTPGTVRRDQMSPSTPEQLLAKAVTTWAISIAEDGRPGKSCSMLHLQYECLMKSVFVILRRKSPPIQGLFGFGLQRGH